MLIARVTKFTYSGPFNHRPYKIGEQPNISKTMLLRKNSVLLATAISSEDASKIVASFIPLKSETVLAIDQSGLHAFLYNCEVFTSINVEK